MLMLWGIAGYCIFLGVRDRKFRLGDALNVGLCLDAIYGSVETLYRFASGAKLESGDEFIPYLIVGVLPIIYLSIQALIDLARR